MVIFRPLAWRENEVRQELEAVGRDFFGAAFRAQALILEPLAQVMAPERAEDGSGKAGPRPGPSRSAAG